MVQAAVLSYLPLYAVQALGFDKIGAGLLVAASQAGGAASRLGLGLASDRWLGGRRSTWLALTGALGCAIFACLRALARVRRRSPPVSWHSWPASAPTAGSASSS